MIKIMNENDDNYDEDKDGDEDKDEDEDADHNEENYYGTYHYCVYNL